MNLIDFIIGLTMVNALPHFVLGVYKGRILSLFGFGNIQNMLYSALNFTVFLSLFQYKYGLASIAENGIVAGALFVVVSYYITCKFLYGIFHEQHYAKQEGNPLG